MESDIRGLIDVMEQGLRQMGEYGDVGFTTDVFEYFAEMLQTEEGERALKESLERHCTSMNSATAISGAVCVIDAILNLRGKP